MKEPELMICITGAGGTVGRELLGQLAAAKAPLRAAYHSAQKARAAQAKGVEAVVIDYEQPESLRNALRGCEQLFLLGPNLPNQTRLEQNAVEAARAAGVRRIVKQSVFGADEAGFALARVHRPVEQAIEAAGFDWTFLRPNSFMQNVVTYMAETIRAEGAFYSATGGARISHVDVRDIAAVAVKVLTAPGHDKKAYTLTGPEALSYDELAGELSKALGRTIRHVDLAPAELRAGLVGEGMPEEIAERMLDLESFYRNDRASGVTGDIEQVTGRAPRRFAQYARDCAPLLRPGM